VDSYKIEQINPEVTAIIVTPPGAISNVGIIYSKDGIVIIDTMRGAKRLAFILKRLGITPTEVTLVINTHLHSDHVDGNALFDCPILCHEKAKQRIAGKRSQGLKTISFDEEYLTEIGGIRLHLFHTPGHTPESLIVWLPDYRVLFSGDLIFTGRAPFMGSTANFDQLVTSLKRLLTFGADVIVPGHGLICYGNEVHWQIKYLEQTWEVVREHVKAGNSVGAILKDKALPQSEGGNFQRNVVWMYKRIKKRLRE